MDDPDDDRQTPVGCMFCGGAIEWRDVEPLVVTFESAPGAEANRDVWPFAYAMYSHAHCLDERTSGGIVIVPFRSALKRLRPPGTAP